VAGAALLFKKPEKKSERINCPVETQTEFFLGGRGLFGGCLYTATTPSLPAPPFPPIMPVHA